MAALAIDQYRLEARRRYELHKRQQRGNDNRKQSGAGAGGGLDSDSLDASDAVDGGQDSGASLLAKINSHFVRQTVRSQVQCSHSDRSNTMCVECVGRPLVERGARGRAACAAYHWLYADVSLQETHNASSSEKRSVARDTTSERALIYGEVEFWSFVRLLEIAQPKKGERFFDLGSGIGKPTVAAALMFPEFASCTGIELLSSLHAIAELTTAKLAGASMSLQDTSQQTGDTSAPRESSEGRRDAVSEHKQDTLKSRSSCEHVHLPSKTTDDASTSSSHTRHLQDTLCDSHTRHLQSTDDASTSHTRHLKDTMTTSHARHLQDTDGASTLRRRHLQDTLCDSHTRHLQNTDDASTSRHRHLQETLSDSASRINFVNGDFMATAVDDLANASDSSWLSGDVVYIASTAFSDDFMERLSEMARRHLKRGARVVTLSRSLSGAEKVTSHISTGTAPTFVILEERRYRMSWGNVMVVVQMKT